MHTLCRSLLVLAFACVQMLSAGCTKDRASTPVVTANGEVLHGLWAGTDGHIAAFKGIPFAAPPVGELRWRAPATPTPRKGPQMATAYAPGCMQTTYSTDWYARVAAAFDHGPEVAARPVGVSEDCLYLNVWSPQLDPNARLPVLVWVHGGSNKGGWSYEPNYVGERLAAKGAVVVSIAYRMGAFGFFSHPALDNGENEPIANFGWLDTHAAMQWVADNITIFGGDPENITGIGESSGAGDLSDWLAAGIGKTGLVRRMILQSSASSLAQRRTLADEQATGLRLVNSLGLEAETTAKRLREIPAVDLLAATDSELQGHYFDAVIDGLTMIERPMESLLRAETASVDVLIGTNADEWYMYIDQGTSRADLIKWVNANAPEHADALLAEIEEENDIRRAMDRLGTAKNTLCPSRYLAARVTELGGRGWVYLFSRQRPGAGGEKLGAYHGTEIPYVFDMHDDWLPGEEIDHALTDAVMDYWIQFARNGDPNLPGSPEWPLYGGANPMVMELGDNIAAMEPHDARLCALLGPEHKPKPGKQP